MSLSLPDLQAWMQDALVFPEGIGPEDVEQIVEPGPVLSAPQRLAIYQRSYIHRLIKCMDAQFPALRHALGSDLFGDFAREFLRAHPSESYTLYELGRRFPGYLEETRPDADEREAWIDFMVDLATYERQLFVLFDAPGHEGKPFAGPDTPDERLSLQPCFALGDYRFPVGWYFHEVRNGNHPPLPPPDRTYLALVRKDYLTHTFRITGPQHTFLAALAAGAGVPQALERVAGESGRPLGEVTDSWSDTGGIRARWLAAGFFVEAG